MRQTTYEHLAGIPNLAELTFANYPLWNHTLPLPPQLLMGSTGTYELALFLLVGSSWAQVVSHYLKPNATVLDIGCGCGKTARFLANNSHISQYIGFDVLRPSIDWAKRYLAPKTKGRFEFCHADIYNAEYNPHGILDAYNYQFPARDSTIDVAFAASLFTHLLENDAKHYLAQITRVLKPGGVAIISLHINPQPGCSYSGTEARIDVDLDYFTKVAAACNLSLYEKIGDLCGQETLVFQRQS